MIFVNARPAAVASMRTMMKQTPPENSKAVELRTFLLLAVVMAPVLAVIVVSGYGFLVWMVQLLAGPPGSL